MYFYLMRNTFFYTSLLLVLFGAIENMAFAQSLELKNNQKLIQPNYLKVGDTVAIVAPSGVLKERTDEIERAKKLLTSWGLHYEIGKNLYKKNNHFAGTDAERCEDMQEAMDAPNVKAIWCARGGYGTVRILDKLDYTKFKKKPKWLIGYSDITALHSQLHINGFESIHALMCVSLTKNLEELGNSISTFKKAIFGAPISYTLKGNEHNRIGTVEAPLVGGNLTLLHTLLGSKTSISTKGKILFIEEIGEYKYHIDRMLQSLKRAGYFNDCAGVLVGDMSKLRKNTTLWGTSVEQLIVDALSEYNFPIAFNMPAGHEKDNRALLLGRTVKMQVTKNKTSLIFNSQ